MCVIGVVAVVGQPILVGDLHEVRLAADRGVTFFRGVHHVVVRPALSDAAVDSRQTRFGQITLFFERRRHVADKVIPQHGIIERVRLRVVLALHPDKRQNTRVHSVRFQHRHAVVHLLHEMIIQLDILFRLFEKPERRRTQPRAVKRRSARRVLDYIESFVGIVLGKVRRKPDLRTERSVLERGITPLPEFDGFKRGVLVLGFRLRVVGLKRRVGIENFHVVEARAVLFVLLGRNHGFEILAVSPAHGVALPRKHDDFRDSFGFFAAISIPAVAGMLGIAFFGISRLYRRTYERMRRNVRLFVTDRALAPVVVLVVLYGIVVIAVCGFGRIVATARNRCRRKYRNQRENEYAQPNSSFHFSSRRRSYFTSGVKSKMRFGNLLPSRPKRIYPLARDDRRHRIAFILHRLR